MKLFMHQPLRMHQTKIFSLWLTMLVVPIHPSWNNIRHEIEAGLFTVWLFFTSKLQIENGGRLFLVSSGTCIIKNMAWSGCRTINWVMDHWKNLLFYVTENDHHALLQWKFIFIIKWNSVCVKCVLANLDLFQFVFWWNKEMAASSNSAIIQPTPFDFSGSSPLFYDVMFWF